MGKLEVDGLVKSYSDENEIVAVDDLNLAISDGEFLVLVGPSGCGKSTTLRCIAGLERITSGDIRIDGASITERKPKDRDIAMVFQNYALYPHMTARENMSFGLKMITDLSEEEIDDRVNDVAEMMGIRDLLNKKPNELSGGQQQRVATGRAIVREPEVFLFDEPLSNLDAKLRTQMRTELQDLQQNLGITTIYVTHDQTEAMTMGDRIAILNDGKLQQVGTPMECYYKPANQFVAGFIGSPSMNFFDVTLDGGGETVAFEHPAFSYPITSEIADQLESTGSEFVLGIRPEDISVAEETHEHTIFTEVQVVEPLGNIMYVYFTMDGENYTASVDSGSQIRPGDTIELEIPEKSVHVFDGQAGETIKNCDVDLEDIEFHSDDPMSSPTSA